MGADYCFDKALDGPKLSFRSATIFAALTLRCPLANARTIRPSLRRDTRSHQLLAPVLPSRRENS